MNAISLMAADGSSGSMATTLITFVLIILIFYFLIIRPQKKRDKEAKAMIDAMKKGDRVVTIGGIHGTIVAVREQTVVVKVDDSSRIEFSKSAISSVTSKDKVATAAQGAKKEEKADKKDVKVTFPEDYHAENLKGKDATFKVTVHEVKEVKVPELDKDFFDDLGMEGINTKEELEAQISENIIARKEMEAENKYMDDLLEAAAKDVKVDIPEAMISEELDRMIQQYADHLKMQGITIEQFYQFTNSDEEALKDQMRPEAIKRITYRLMLEEIAKEEKIEIDDKEAKEEAKKLAEKYQMKEEEFLSAFGGLDIVKYDMKMRKAMEILKK